MRAPFDPRIVLPEVSEILPLLFMGMRPATYVGYQLVISCEEHLAKKPMAGYTGMTIHVPFKDEADHPVPELAVKVAAVAAVQVMERAGRVLVHCTGGLNRSGLMAAEILKAQGCSPSHAVELIRDGRDLFCLHNRQFERWVLEERLPTAETSMFRPGAE